MATRGAVSTAGEEPCTSGTDAEVPETTFPRIASSATAPMISTRLQAASINHLFRSEAMREAFWVASARTRANEAVCTGVDAALVAYTEFIAAHPRSWDRDQQIEDPTHIEALIEHKRQAREHCGMDRLHHAIPSSKRLFQEIAQRGGNLGSVTCGLSFP